MSTGDRRISEEHFRRSSARITPKGPVRPKMAAHNGDLQNKIVYTLREHNGPMDTVAIAHSTGLRTRKQINPTLYKMQQQGTILKVSDTPPKWGLKHEVTLGHEVMLGHGVRLGHASKVTGQSSPLRSHEDATCMGANEEHNSDVNEETTSMPSLEYTSDSAPIEDTKTEIDEKFDAYSSEARDNGYSYPHRERLVQYKATPLQDSSQVPVHYKSEPEEEDSISDLGRDQNAGELQMDSESAKTSNDLPDRLAPCSGDEMECLDQQDGAINGYPNIRTVGKAGELLKPIIAQPENTTSLSHKLLSALCTLHVPIHSNDLAKRVGCRSKKEINPTLFGMQKQALVQKVSESPPLWVITTNGRQTLSNGDQINHQSSQHPQQQHRQFQTPQFRAPRGPVPRNNGQSNHFQGPPPSPAMLLQGHGSSQFSQSYENTEWINSNSLIPPLPPADQDTSNWWPSLSYSDHNQAGLPSHSAMGLPLNDAGASHNATVSSEMFGAINKNPISALTEYAQSRHLHVGIDMIHQSGPPHNPRVGNRSFTRITSKSKKDGRREAADVALRALIAEGNYQMKMSTSMLDTTTGNSTTFYDDIAGLSHQAFNTIAAGIPDNISGRKVLAALIMKRGEDDKGTVISLGTGNRCVTGDMLSLEGGTVNDSHAEIITRRAFLRYLYNQLTAFRQNPDNTILSEVAPGRFRVKQDMTFHLYISTAPCGDGAQFSRTDAGENAEGPEGLEFTGQSQHLPTFAKNIQGLLRTKMEYGEGTIPVDSNHPVQTWDGIIRGERLRTMSCSDKVARWNILGLQGALLSQFIEPVYLSSLTLGSLYHHGHLSRAVCCRLNHSAETQELTTTLPPSYRINHPQLGCVTAFDPPRGTEKTKALSINWFISCPGPEVIDGTKGRIQGVVPSQLCKSTLFAEFRRIAQLYGRDDLLQARTYHEAKGLATEFQAAKLYMKEAFQKDGYGVWIEKPIEEELFSL